ncbi:MAG: hypothetical protein ACE1ZY_04435, partial [Alphaproteobacteria bacterium]
FTIAVAWPKGFVAEPTASEETANLLRDNASLAAGLVGLVLLLAYFLTVWGRVGRDPAKGPIMPEYGPPDGFSPAAARYVTRMGRMIGQVQRGGQARRCGHVGEQGVDAWGPDDVQHLGPVAIGQRQVAHHSKPST